MFNESNGFTASGLYGMAPQGPTYGVAAPTQHMATDSLQTGMRGLADIHNPLLWFGIVLLVTVGAAGAAGSIKLGPAKVSAALGK